MRIRRTKELHDKIVELYQTSDNPHKLYLTDWLSITYKVNTIKGPSHDTWYEAEPQYISFLLLRVQ